MKLKNIIRWFIPFGYAVKIIKKHNTNYSASGKVNDIPISNIWMTPYHGVFLVYSKEVHDKGIMRQIEQLQKEIDGLEGCLND